MKKTYSPHTIEQLWYEHWEKKGYFDPEYARTQTVDSCYSIMIPPPNVTGSLHMGHAFQHTLQDILIRYYRMKGYKTLWQVGTDHAGIATQMVVERQLVTNKQPSRHAMGREEFVDRIWQWKKQSGGQITRQMRRLGNSVDWNSERFTLDSDYSKAVQKVFVQLFNEGLIYRGKRLVNWDPKLGTAISDLEVENKEVQGHMWYIRYPLTDNHSWVDEQGQTRHFLVVATTRPETLLGDAAVAVDPNDPRYQHLIGKYVRLPLSERLIPIISDRHADRKKGSGCVKITPAHDFNDYAVGMRHALPLINIFTKEASIEQQAMVFDHKGNTQPTISIPPAYQGLDRFSARKKIIEHLQKKGLLEKIIDHSLIIPYGDRSGVIIEPLLTDQWYVDAKKLAKPAIKAVKQGDIQFVPKNYNNMYFAWMNDIQDWCISRQLWWGHRIPAWYDLQGNVYVGHNEDEIRKQYQLDRAVKLHQDEDVLDTWFSSALWTFVTQGWPNTEDETVKQKLHDFHPSNVLVTGFDIIFFWVARMIMMSLHLCKDKKNIPQIPFKTVYITGLIRDENGQKMSKSKGNVLDPLDMIDGIDLEALVKKRCHHLMQPALAKKIEQRTRKTFPKGILPYGTDSLRFTLAALASTGRDIHWDMKRLEGYRNFCNKLWNASRYVLQSIIRQPLKDDHQRIMITEEMKVQCATNGETVELSLADRWILSRLQSVTKTLTHHLNQYRFDLATQSIYEFIWNEYCDWYLECSKPILWDENVSEHRRRGTLKTLVGVLETLLRLLHPFMPFITEEIWQQIHPLVEKEGHSSSIMLAAYPSFNESFKDSQAEKEMIDIQQVVIATRQLRHELSIIPSQSTELIIKKATAHYQGFLEAHLNLLSRLVHVKNIYWLAIDEEEPLSIKQPVGTMEVMIAIKDHINIKKEIQRLEKKLLDINKQQQRVNSKLDNSNFVDKAPDEILKKEKDKQTRLVNEQQLLQTQLTRLYALN